MLTAAEIAVIQHATILPPNMWGYWRGVQWPALALYVYRGGEIQKNRELAIPIDRIDARQCIGEIADALGYATGKAYLEACDKNPLQVRQRLDALALPGTPGEEKQDV